MVNPFTFLQEVRAEANKVTWPSRRETMVSVGLVFFFSVVLGTYFLLVDKVLSWGVALIFG